MLHNNTARAFVLDFNRVNDLFNLLNTDIPKRYMPSFPPADVYQLGNDWVIRMAVAGYTKDDIQVQVEDEQLIVKSTKADTEVKLPEGVKVIQSNISKRAFERRWQLSEGMEVVDVVLQDGMLNIGVTKHTPEHKKPKTFDIASKPTLAFKERISGLLN